MKKKKDISEESKNQSFLEKMKTDKKYSAKVQLIFYGVVIAFLVLYLNIVNLGNSEFRGNLILDHSENGNDVLEEENASQTGSSLLKKIDNNYRYDVKVKVKKKNEEVDPERLVHYFGKVYEEQKEITKEDINGSRLYYKVDNHYYIQSDTNLELASSEVIYDLISGDYVELDNILKLLDKASLDHVTDYSSGKKEYVYHLKVKDVFVNYQKEDIISININEENEVLTIFIDYTNLLYAVDELVEKCELEATYTEIGKIEKFSVINEGENTSTE